MLDNEREREGERERDREREELTELELLGFKSRQN